MPSTVEDPTDCLLEANPRSSIIFELTEVLLNLIEAEKSSGI
jgi:hypothetical protein